MRILIADDHGIVREGLKSLIDKQPDMQVVAEAENGKQAVELAAELRPDLIIMDVAMPDMNGAEAARQILEQFPQVRIIALSIYSNRGFVSEMLKAGVCGYVLKSCLFDELVRAIYTVTSNEYYLSPSITNVLIEDYISHGREARKGSAAALSEREQQMVRFLAEGLSIKQIALRLGISPKTADAGRRQIMSKLDIHSVAGLTKYAIREGLTPIEP